MQQGAFAIRIRARTQDAMQESDACQESGACIEL